VQTLRPIWQIKFYNGQRKALSLVRSLKYFALWSDHRITADTACGPLGTAASL